MDMTSIENTITHVAKDRILLTFDDGPKPDVTPLILDILREYNMKACFFVRGDLGVLYPKLLKRIVDEGHELGNHTWNHIRMLRASESDISKELETCQQLIETTTGKPARFFRPPYGEIRSDTVNMIKEQFDMDTMLWSLESKDWERPSAEVLHTKIMSVIQGGDIILLHELIEMAKALPKILSSIQSLGSPTKKFVEVIFKGA